MSSSEKKLPWRNERTQRRRKPQSFSSSLLDAIYHSIDESRGEPEQEEERKVLSACRRNNGVVEVEDEIASLRRAIMLEKWMESYTRSTQSLGNFNCESNFCSSSETEPAKTLCEANLQKREGRFMRTKSRALKIYGDLKKVKQPISPGGKITNFFNSIFNSRSNTMMKKKQEVGIEDWSSVRQSRSVKDSSRACLNREPSSRGKSKRTLSFCPVSVILDKHCCENQSFKSIPCISSSHYIKKSSLDSELKNMKKRCNSRGSFCHENSISDEEDDDDDRSCASSDLFELENVGSFCSVDASEGDELPVYGTTRLRINQDIANGFTI